MAKPRKSFKDGFTIESLQGGSNSGPGKGAGAGAFRGAPTLSPINSGERVTGREDSGDKDIYPPVYGGGNRQITVTSKKRRGGAGGYVPSSTERSNAPKAL